MSLISQTLNLENSCDQIVKSVRNSCLNFSIQETPYSLYLTIRKSFTKAPQDSSNDLKNESENIINQEIETLKARLSEAEKRNQRLQSEHEEVVNDSEVCYKKIESLETRVLNDKEEIVKLESDLEDVEKNWKDLMKQVKEKDKEIHDLKKENKIISDSLAELKTNFSNLTATVNREKKKEEKRQKKVESKEFLDSLKNESKEPQFPCDLCDMKCESKLKLRTHVRFFHMKNSSSQTDEIQEIKDIETHEKELEINKNLRIKEEVSKPYEKYSCFYCQKEIASELQFIEHRVTCQGATENPSLFSFPIRPIPLLFKCIVCGFVSDCKRDLLNHKKRMHEPQ
jgi:DNA repair exonuclease SbcCD ATPase subunit